MKVKKYGCDPMKFYRVSSFEFTCEKTHNWWKRVKKYGNKGRGNKKNSKKEVKSILIAFGFNSILTRSVVLKILGHDLPLYVKFLCPFMAIGKTRGRDVTPRTVSLSRANRVL